MKTKSIRPNPFVGASDIYVTKNKIVVTSLKNVPTKRSYTKTTKTKYYEQNESNLKLLKAAKVKTVRVGRKSNNYRNV